jgi:hypothetical protein
MAKNWKDVKKKRQSHDAPKKENMQEQFYTRILHRAYLRDRDITYTGEALALALLLHAKGKDRKSQSGDVAKMLDDPNA